jgi:hypothetical protein
MTPRGEGSSIEIDSVEKNLNNTYTRLIANDKQQSDQPPLQYQKTIDSGKVIRFVPKPIKPKSFALVILDQNR